MRPDQVELDRLATQHGFLAATLEKVLRLGELLVEFGRHPLLRGALLLKGGTLVAKPATDVAGAARFRR